MHVDTIKTTQNKEKYKGGLIKSFRRYKDSFARFFNMHCLNEAKTFISHLPKEKYISLRGTHVYATNAAPCFIGRKNGINHIYLPENPTALQVKHELSHWLDFKRLGYDEYSKLSTYQREKMVLDRLQNNKIWGDLNQLEKDFSLNYIEQFKYGHTPGVSYE